MEFKWWAAWKMQDADGKSILRTTDEGREAAADMEKREDKRVGKTLDRRYELLSVLGTGPRAVVYQAFDHASERPVVVKLFSREAAAGENSLRRFRTAYQVIGRLRHPNIRALYNVGSSIASEYMVMEYVDGISLGGYMRRKGVLTWQEALHVAIQTARALSYAHGQGVIHGNIKPENILIAKSGMVKLADFDAGKLPASASGDAAAETADSAGSVPPEQTDGQTPDPRQDILSLGMVMYQMLTGNETPGTSDLEHGDIPPGLEAIALKAIKPDPEERYQTAEEMLEELVKFRDGQQAMQEKQDVPSDAQEGEQAPNEAADAQGAEQGHQGKTLNRRYELQAIVDTGSKAVIYQGFDHKLNRRVTVKVSKTSSFSDEESLHRFRAAYQGIGRLRHPNILALYNVGASDAAAYIVTEYFEGISLGRYLSRKEVLPWQETLRITIQAAGALRYAHGQGVIHRDIKPENILLSKDGLVKLADFGVEKLSDGAADDTATETGEDLGYISPEQAKGEPPDQRSDIFSLGAVAYEMLTGRRPFTGGTAEELTAQYDGAAPEAPSAVNPDIPPALEAIVLKAIKPNPEDRFQTAGEMLEELKKLQEDQPDEVLTKNVPPSADHMHVIYKDVPRISRTGELSREGFVRRRAKERSTSNLLGFGLVLLFVVGLFSYVWSSWLGELFSDPERTEVPNFVGYNLSDVIQNDALKELFTFSVEYEESEDYEAGRIMKQEPAAGASCMIVPEGIAVKFTVSTGAAVVYVEMPNLVFHPYAESLLQLQVLGLEVEVVMEASNTVTSNYVISTEPAAGETVASGSVVILHISAGPNVSYVEVPDLVGLMELEARAALHEAGLMCSDDDVDYVETSPDNAGRVLWQDYEAGQTVVSGSSIHIQVGVSYYTGVTPAFAEEDTDAPEGLEEDGTAAW